MRRVLVGCAILGLMIGAGQARAADPLSADQIISILNVEGQDTGSAPVTRSLKPTTGTRPEADRPGSGRISDLAILFPFNSAEITPAEEWKLKELGTALASDKLKVFQFEIAGYTDAVGSEKYNLWLSGERAAAVVDYITRNYDVDPSRVQAVGHGEAQLANAADPASSENRRVEVLTVQ